MVPGFFYGPNRLLLACKAIAFAQRTSLSGILHAEGPYIAKGKYPLSCTYFFFIACV
jgi:hypothetical protein